MREDVRRARTIAQAMLTFTLALPVILVFLWVASPGSPGGPVSDPPWYVVAMPWSGVALYLFGLGWMVRIYPSRAGSADTTWRYRL